MRLNLNPKQNCELRFTSCPHTILYREYNTENGFSFFSFLTAQIRNMNLIYYDMDCNLPSIHYIYIQFTIYPIWSLNPPQYRHRCSRNILSIRWPRRSMYTPNKFVCKKMLCMSYITSRYTIFWIVYILTWITNTYNWIGLNRVATYLNWKPMFRHYTLHV